MSQSEKSGMEVMAEILTDERETRNAVEAEYKSLRAAFTQLAQAITNDAQTEGVGPSEGDRFVNVYNKLVAKLRTERDKARTDVEALLAAKPAEDTPLGSA